MRTFILSIMAALAGMACRAQEPRPEGGVRILTAGQHITPYRIGVPFSKTVHILFPSEVRYVDLGSTDIIAGKADGVENVVRVKAAVRDFPGETNFSVITGDGSFYSFLVSYDEETEALNINMDSRFPAGPSAGGSAVRVTELGEEDPLGHRQPDVHRTPSGPQGREAYRLPPVRDAGPAQRHLCA